MLLYWHSWQQSHDTDSHRCFRSKCTVLTISLDEQVFFRVGVVIKLHSVQFVNIILKMLLPVKRFSQRVPVRCDKRHVLFSRWNDGNHLNIWNPPVNVTLLWCVMFIYCIVYYSLPPSSLPIKSSSASVMMLLREQRLCFAPSGVLEVTLRSFSNQVATKAEWKQLSDFSSFSVFILRKRQKKKRLATNLVTFCTKLSFFL